MMRDDSTGGWVPLGGGGLSMVAVRKRKLAEDDLGGALERVTTSSRIENGGAENCEGYCLYEYLIIGRRISDDHDVLSCTIKRDFEYNRVMPTFHHWRTGNKKFGLTFQTAADARTFDKGITRAVEDLMDEGELGEYTPLQINMDVGEGVEGEVFMMLDLPLERDSQPSSPRSPPPRVTSPPPTSPHSVRSRGTPSSSSPLYQDTPILNQLNSQRLHPLTRSNTVGGHTRGSIRGSGLPPGAPRPPGDNIYEWLHSSEQQPLSRTNNSALSVKSDKYIVISGPAGRGLYSPDPGPYSPDRGHYSPSRIPYSPDRGHYSPDRAPYSPDKGDYGPGKECLRLDNDNFSDTYVRFDIKDPDPQYHYPNLDTLSNMVPGMGKNGGRRCSISSLKGQTAGLGLEDTFSPGKEKDWKGKKGKKEKKGGCRLHYERCAHCQELYSESENKKGSCSYSPDRVRQCIDCVSCLACAKCLLYHCHYEDENFSEEEICTCTDTDGHLAKRWLGLSLLAVLVPCLCLYPMLTACYSCGRACHACGGKHVPV
ncbi:sprouty-related, EVH1 domain-containing protein 2 isoform X2 [Eurytemora carolleeae]|uniref:sprouty-related, EVH1 domain-containing protein 2 isoform X2 n=1 Tax=Eurytemora carolleeae TaxID=1294199 RepID=UPI000C76FF1D|nr:sprouty-related, EVH1 domain-containing protein 2 isoform X2 [Eurytemora carolleeae]|eukprot:XP_023341147.1 sprouty-related, EVH1 domain-containing protein 2-like isoform X2 [Eurytemora affinis]